MPESFLDRMPYMKQEFKANKTSKLSMFAEYEDDQECSEENLNTNNRVEEAVTRKRKSHVRFE